ncbi:NAD-dependent epimerase/dehydratase family protein [Lichenibacterium ramalinae]|uniref:NAD-dependent epimerase/dehydratase family protein n=1 Tax=Lichenibacterium ramalinae TaxID=2316527 RepID=A0A4V1RJ96_9HYPH|nr:NAD-dependent epimerase/dehydratase family protein [Lichenibacterium ramalinae]RYB07790.1 NAD-dependent epimerase/dehydratase family protein [Lichenibacterium ramalinae]
MAGEVPSRILVTGGAGFIGSNLSDRLLGLGHRVTVYDALSRPGVARNLDWLKARHGDALDVVVADVRDGAALAAAAAEAEAVFHLAAQVAVTTSMVDPLADFEINVRATVTLLDALRRRDVPVPLVFASTNKVYGDLADVALQLTNDAYVPADPALRATGIGEARPLDFHTPYGCSKGAADQYALDFARSFGVPTAVLRMSCIYGPRQMGTEDQGWVAHFAIRALKGEGISLFGDGCQVRDVLDVDDAVDAYLGCWRNMDRVAGRAFNLGGGPANAISLRQLLRHIEGLTGRPVAVENHGWRPGDQRYYVSDTRRVADALGLRPWRPWRDGVARLVGWLADEHGIALAPAERMTAGGPA